MTNCSLVDQLRSLDHNNANIASSSALQNAEMELKVHGEESSRETLPASSAMAAAQSHDYRLEHNESSFHVNPIYGERSQAVLSDDDEASDSAVTSVPTQQWPARSSASDALRRMSAAMAAAAEAAVSQFWQRSFPAVKIRQDGASANEDRAGDTLADVYPARTEVQCEDSEASANDSHEVAHPSARQGRQPMQGNEEWEPLRNHHTGQWRAGRLGSQEPREQLRSLDAAATEQQLASSQQLRHLQSLRPTDMPWAPYLQAAATSRREDSGSNRSAATVPSTDLEGTPWLTTTGPRALHTVAMNGNINDAEGPLLEISSAGSMHAPADRAEDDMSAMRDSGHLTFEVTEGFDLQEVPRVPSGPPQSPGLQRHARNAVQNPKVYEGHQQLTEPPSIVIAHSTAADSKVLPSCHLAIIVFNLSEVHLELH